MTIFQPVYEPTAAAVRFVFSKQDVAVLDALKKEHPDFLIHEDVGEVENREVTDSSTRFGCFLMRAQTQEELERYLPQAGVL